jgi:hypothetical protein
MIYFAMTVILPAASKIIPLYPRRELDWQRFSGTGWRIEHGGLQ